MSVSKSPKGRVIHTPDSAPKTFQPSYQDAHGRFMVDISKNPCLTEIQLNQDEESEENTEVTWGM